MSDTESRRPPATSELGTPYWEKAAEGVLGFQACDACGEAIFPAKPVCPACWSSDLEWHDASGRAQLESFSVVHRAPSPAFAAEVPYVVALVRLEEGPRMMTNVVGCDAEEVEIGMDLTVTFTQYDGFVLPQFTPVNA